MRKVIVTTGALIAQGAASGLVSETLTARERDILAMIGQGLSNKRIARAREISPETVKSHVKHIFLKLAVSSRAQAVYQAESLGLLRGGNPRQEEGRRSAVAVSRSNFLAVAAILSSAIVANGYAGPVLADLLFVGARSPATVYSPSPERTLLAQASGEDTVAQQLFDLWSRHNTDGYAKPLGARMALEDCRKGSIASGVAALKRALEREQIPIPPAESRVAQTPVPLKGLPLANSPSFLAQPRAQWGATAKTQRALGRLLHVQPHQTSDFRLQGPPRQGAAHAIVPGLFLAEARAAKP